MSKTKPIEPIDTVTLAMIEAAMYLRGDMRARGVNLTAREILSMIERIKRAEKIEGSLIDALPINKRLPLTDTQWRALAWLHDNGPIGAIPFPPGLRQVQVLVHMGLAEVRDREAGPLGFNRYALNAKGLARWGAGR